MSRLAEYRKLEQQLAIADGGAGEYEKRLRSSEGDGVRDQAS